MAIIIEFTIPSESFKFGSVLNLGSDVEVRVEQLVPIGDSVMPFSWVSGNIGAFEKRMEQAGMDYSVVVEDSERVRNLYHLEWDAEGNELIQAILDSKGAVINAVGRGDEWRFQVRFKEREDVSEFHERCADRMPVEVVKIYDPIEVSGNTRSGMSTTQLETLLDAYEAGYFKVPRETTLVELSEKYDISDQAVSERLRRGIAELIESGLVTGKKDRHFKESV